MTVDRQGTERSADIFRERMMTYFAKRYGAEMQVGPAVLYAIVNEQQAVELGEDFTSIRGHVDELLDAVEYLGNASSAEICRLAQAFVILARIAAGEPKSAPTVREGLQAAIELLDAASAPTPRSAR